MTALTPIPPIFEHDMTPIVKALIARNEEYAGMILMLREQVQLLKDEIAVLKGQKPRPKIPPNRLEKDKPDSSDKNKDREGKRPGSAKRDKTSALEVDETRQIQPENIPPNSKFKGWSNYVVQELVVNKKVILFQLACFVDANGKALQAATPRI
jgi:hypothetical protein